MSGTVTPGTTLLLDQTLWDLCADASGNIALASPPYAAAQDAASQIRLFLGELWYDTTQGVPYLTQTLGKYPPASLIKAQLKTAALLVPGVASATVYISGISGRNLTGQVQITDNQGNTAPVAFGSGSAGAGGPFTRAFNSSFS